VDFLRDNVPLYLLLAVLFSGVLGVAFGLGLGWVNSALKARSAETSLENAGVRITRLVNELADTQRQMAEMREEMAGMRAELRMQGREMLNSQRNLEREIAKGNAIQEQANELLRENALLQRELIALKTPGGVAFHVGGNATISGDVVGEEKTVTAK
jgi:hypothetical protein